MDAQKGAATGDFADVLDQLNTLNGDGARAAFDAMSGEIYGSLATISLENNDRFLRSIARRMRVQSMTQGSDFSTADARNCSLVYVNRLTFAFRQPHE